MSPQSKTLWWLITIELRWRSIIKVIGDSREDQTISCLLKTFFNESGNKNRLFYARSNPMKLFCSRTTSSQAGSAALCLGDPECKAFYQDTEISSEAHRLLYPRNCSLVLKGDDKTGVFLVKGKFSQKKGCFMSKKAIFINECIIIFLNEYCILRSSVRKCFLIFFCANILRFFFSLLGLEKRILTVNFK